MVRKSFLYEDHGTYCTLAKLNNAILSVDYIKNNINHFAEELNLNTSSIPRDNISYEILEIAVEVFTYLNHCPQKLTKLIQHILETEAPKDIILAFTSIMKTSNMQMRIDLRKIFLKIMESFKLEDSRAVMSPFKLL